MESCYGIGINNRYALFLDSDNEGDSSNLEEIVAKKAQESKKSAKVNDASNAKISGGTNPATKKDPSAKVTNPATTNNRDATNKTNVNREDKENRNNRFEGKRVVDARKVDSGPKDANREERNNRRNRPEVQGGSGQLPTADRTVEASAPRGRGGGGGGDRGGRGARGVGRGGRGGERGGSAFGGRSKREYERKSGDDRTGVKAVDKREGSGSHNWGTIDDEIKAETDQVNTSNEEPVDAPNKDSEAKEVKEGQGEGDEGDEPKEDDEPKTLTLDEWKAQQAHKSGPKFNTRKAGEGSDIDPKWKKTYAYKKEKETNEEDEDEETELYPQRVNRQKRVLDIEFNFTDLGRGGQGGGRGGRGGPRGGNRGGGRGGGLGGGDRMERGERRDEPRVDRGGRGERRGGGVRGGGRGGRGGRNYEAPNVNDEASFPSLG